MCNTGVYFMQARVARRLITVARGYLEKSRIDPRLRTTIPYAPTYFGIDSVILWAAQHTLNYTVQILPPTLNFMVPAEKFIVRDFISTEYQECDAAAAGADDDIDNMDNDDSITITRTSIGVRGVQEPLDLDASAPSLRIQLLHLSTGSELYFIKAAIPVGGRSRSRSSSATNTITSNTSAPGETENNDFCEVLEEKAVVEKEQEGLNAEIDLNGENSDIRGPYSIAAHTAATPTSAEEAVHQPRSTSMAAAHAAVAATTTSAPNAKKEEEKEEVELEQRCIARAHGFAFEASLTLPLLTSLLDNTEACLAFYEILKRYENEANIAIAKFDADR
jgi:hypothetical protein